MFISLLEAIRLDFYVADVGDSFEFADDVSCDFFMDHVDGYGEAAVADLP